MHWERLTTSGRPVYAEAMDLYRASFPSHEQREEAAQRELMGHPEYHFNLIYEEERLAGLLLCWETERFLYVEHFCIHPLFRGRGYGQRALEMLREHVKPNGPDAASSDVCSSDLALSETSRKEL